jgi:putative proteasome-type protease
MINKTWGERLRQLFGEIPNPSWTDLADVPLRPRETRSTVPRLVIGDLPCSDAPAQTLAEDVDTTGKAPRQ